jgi:drug/metabolite transporter (DMT)-like permease
MSHVPWAFALALVGTLSLAALYRAFALGPIAVVSPVVASYAALSVVGIVLFVGERLSAGQVLAIALTFVGVVIASTDIRELRATLGKPVEGVRVGILATIGFGIWGTLLAAATRTNEPFALVIVWRLFGIAMVAVFVLWRRTRLAPLAVPATLAIIALIGVLDTGANVLLMLGVEAGFASFVMTGSGAYPIIPAVLAILVLRERLAPNQYVGVAILVAGLVALGLQS